MKDSSLGQYLESNPVSYAHPKAPKPCQIRSAKALTGEQIFALLNVVDAKARAGDLMGKRNYALLLYITTGMRRKNREKPFFKTALLHPYTFRAPCQLLFTARRRRRFAGDGLRLRLPRRSRRTNDRKIKRAFTPPSISMLALRGMTST